MNNENYKSEELDLKAVLEFISNTFKKSLVLLFRAFQFVLKFWIVVVVLIIIGAAWGFYSDANKRSYKESTLLVQINNDNVNYAYNALEKLDRKIKDKDSLFLQAHGFDKGRNELIAVVSTPVVNINNLIDKYDEVNNRSLDVFVDVVPFEEEEEKMLESQAFLEEYKYHRIEIIAGPAATPDVVDKLIAYINANKLVAEMGAIYFENVKDRIVANQRTLSQIDAVIESFAKDRPSITGLPAQFVVEKNMEIDKLFDKKLELQTETEMLESELLKSTDSVVLLSNADLVKVRAFTDGRLKFLYPFFLVSLFLLAAFIRYLYIQVKRIAETNEAEKQ
ncbi:hypothetical protein [Altibacter sp.]|uniref:hypothetical protein n=1 Tax=Altibacter sp. TaxID=2024823 RepID=UPI00258A316B|nr:hypothetical protein [Altibacter sp.]MCW8980664.1 hypothetical protein [Altibacter sp.]MCW9037123.1 hypothetical protein [Altibacter sp.]